MEEFMNPSSVVTACPLVKTNCNGPKTLESRKTASSKYRDTVAEIQQKLYKPAKTMWHQPHPLTAVVRGATYMEDQVKVTAGPAVGEFIYGEIFANTKGECTDHYALNEQKRECSIVRLFKERHPDYHLFIVNYKLPGKPAVNLILYWALPLQEDTSDDCSFYKLYRQYISTDSDDFRNSRLKLVPKVVDAPWIVNSTVPQRPALIGQKMKQLYFKGSNYLEIDMDLTSSAVVSKIVSLCRGVAKKLVVDLHFVIEGKNADELPEKIFAAVRLSNVDFSLAPAVSTVGTFK